MEEEEMNVLSGESEQLLSENEEPEQEVPPGKRVISRIRQSWYLQEVMKQTKLAVPVTLTLLCGQSVFLISNVFVSHIRGDAIDLDAAGLGFTFVNMIGVSVGIGLSSAADTLFSQVYGFKNFKKVGVVLQRAILILALTVFPIVAICLNSEPLLLLMQQKPCVVQLASRYVKILSLAIPLVFLLTLLQMYLQAQSIVVIFVFVGIVMNVASATVHGLFLYVADLGVPGAAGALVVAHLFSLLFLIIYIRARGLHRKTWGGWTWACLMEWWPFLRLGLPGMLMICLEWWAFEIGTVITGILGRTELAINSILFNVLAILYMIAVGCSVAVTVRVGNELGGGNPTAAKRAAYCSVTISIVVAALCGTLFLIFRNHIGGIFTTDQKVIDGVATVSYVAGPMLFFDLVMVTVSGILKGSGRQLVGAVTNFVSYYIIGLPLAVYLAFWQPLGVVGVWIGLAVADFIETTVFLLVIVFTNWEYQSIKAIKNAQNKNEDDTATVHTEQENSSGSALELQPLSERVLSTNVTQSIDIDPSSLQESAPTQDHVTSSQVLFTADKQLVENGFSYDPKSISDSDEVESSALSSEESKKGLFDGDKTADLHNRTAATVSARTKCWLLATKGVWFLLGGVLVIGAGVVSSFHTHTHLDSNCTNITNHTNDIIW